MQPPQTEARGRSGPERDLPGRRSRVAPGACAEHVPGRAYGSVPMLSLRTQSFCRYRIHGPVPSPFGEEFHKRLTEHRFLPLMADEERAYGWVTADNLLVTDFNVDTVVRGEYAAFGLRTDQRRVNARLLRAHFDLEVGARLKAARDSGGPARLGRDERKELREELQSEMLRQTTPSVDACTVLVHPRKRLVLVLSLAKRTNELVRLHFLDTFEATLSPLTPWQRSLEILDDQAKSGADLRPALQDLRRADFTRHAPGAQSAELSEPRAAEVSAVLAGGVDVEEVRS
jgi:hypothetical protein